MQENNLKSKTEMEKKRGVILKKQVQLHKSLKKQDQVKHQNKGFNEQQKTFAPSVFGQYAYMLQIINQLVR